MHVSGTATLAPNDKLPSSLAASGLLEKSLLFWKNLCKMKLSKFLHRDKNIGEHSL